MPARLIATLAAGLDEDSRVRQKASGLKHISKTLLMALLIDEVACGFGAKPFAIDTLTVEETKQGDAQVFDSIEDFKAARQKLLENMTHGS